MNQYINSSVLENGQIATVPKPRQKSEIDGSRFHLIMQQVGLGIPVDGLLASNPQLKQWVDAALPYTQIPGDKQWGIELCHKINSIYLIENFDLIVSNQDKVIAVDWTIAKPQDFNLVKESWKTQLRLFLLHQTTGIPCENVSLVYLFVNKNATFQCCYNDKQHEENKQKLEDILIPNNDDQQTQIEVEARDLHSDWMAGKIDNKEYLDAIPEVTWQ